MKRLLKWVGIVAVGLASLLAALVAYVLIASQVMLDRTYPKGPDPIQAATGPAAIARGRHLAAIGLCMDCHGADLAGRPFDVPGSNVYARNLTALTASFSDADFDRAIRHGVRPDGKSVVVMPSNNFANLSDDEVASIIAYLRSLPVRGAVSPAPSLGLLVRLGLVTGQYRTVAATVAAGPPPPIALGRPYEDGRHLARTICAVCHGADLAGMPPGSFLPTPNLLIVGSYDRVAFHTLMRTGKATGGREVGYMSRIARAYFNDFTDEEIDELYDYLAARAYVSRR